MSFPIHYVCSSPRKIVSELLQQLPKQFVLVSMSGVDFTFCDFALVWKNFSDEPILTPILLCTENELLPPATGQRLGREKEELQKCLSQEKEGKIHLNSWTSNSICSDPNKATEAKQFSRNRIVLFVCSSNFGIARINEKKLHKDIILICPNLKAAVESMRVWAEKMAGVLWKNINSAPNLMQTREMAINVLCEIPIALSVEEKIRDFEILLGYFGSIRSIATQTVETLLDTPCSEATAVAVATFFANQ